MDELKINWEQKRPNQIQVAELWMKTEFTRLENWTKSADVLTEKIRKTHVNGGVLLHRYQVISNEHFKWFASRNRLDEIDFVRKTLQRENLTDYRNNLKIK